MLLITVIAFAIIVAVNNVEAAKRPRNYRKICLQKEECPQKEKTQCGTLPSMNNGYFTLDKIGIPTIGARASLKCQYGYRVAGNHVIECLKNAQWSFPYGLCLPVECKTYPTIENGYYELLGPGRYGSVATLICNTGFNLSNGPAIYVKCQADGIWSKPDGNCQKDCGPLPKIDFSYLMSNIYNNIQGAEAMLNCFDGYVVSGNRNVKCENNAGVLEWNTKMAACVPIDCPGLTAENEIANGKYVIVKGEGTLGSVGVFRCNEGFLLCTETVAVCGSDGQWWKTGPEMCVKDLQGTLTISKLDPSAETRYDTGVDPAVDDEIDTCFELLKSRTQAMATAVINIPPGATIKRVILSYTKIVSRRVAPGENTVKIVNGMTTNIPETTRSETADFYSYDYELLEGITSTDAQTLHIENTSTVNTSLLLCDVKVFGC